MEDTAAKGTVLRVKRRRTEDPFQALLIQHSDCKKAKKDDVGHSKDEDSLVFTFAGTLNEDSSSDQQALFGTIESQLENDGLKSISKKLCAKNKRENGAQKKDEKDRRSAFKIISNQQFVKSDSKFHPYEANAARKEKEKMKVLEVVDLVSDDSEILARLKQNDKSNVDEIVCNSARMIREKLTISQDSEIEDHDYVYDLYYANERRLDTDADLLYIQPLDQDILFDFELNGRFDEIEEVYDDEDDSNDESNWRNDYPDEDEIASSDENKGSNYDDDNDSISSEDEEYTYYGYRSSTGRRNFDPYYTEDVNHYNYEAYDENDDDDDG